MKLEALKAGMPYKIYDSTDELKDMIMDMGAKMWGVQQTFGRNNRLVKSYKRNNYKYKTDIPEFVDEVIKRSMEV